MPRGVVRVCLSHFFLIRRQFGSFWIRYVPIILIHAVCSLWFLFFSPAGLNHAEDGRPDLAGSALGADLLLCPSMCLLTPFSLSPTSHWCTSASPKKSCPPLAWSKRIQLQNRLGKLLLPPCHVAWSDFVFFLTALFFTGNSSDTSRLLYSQLWFLCVFSFSQAGSNQAED